MFSLNALMEFPLPEKTLCLTFDDGPGNSSNVDSGPKTAQIAEYLFSQHIQGTFFVVGAQLQNHEDILKSIVSFDHLVGNHTFSHPNFGTMANFPEKVLSEIVKMEKLLEPYITDSSIFFRAPFGIMPLELIIYINENLRSKYNYSGPYLWDIDGRDWYKWEQRQSAQECSDAYLHEIKLKNRGIVLMHDSSADEGAVGDYLRLGNLTFETLLILIPQLKEQGFKFIRLDDPLFCQLINTDPVSVSPSRVRTLQDKQFIDNSSRA